MFTGLVGLGALAIRLVSCNQLSLVDWIVRYWHGRFRVLWLQLRQRISVSLVYMWLSVLFTRFFVVSFGKSNGILNLRTINLKQVGN